MALERDKRYRRCAAASKTRAKTHHCRTQGLGLYARPELTMPKRAHTSRPKTKTKARRAPVKRVAVQPVGRVRVLIVVPRLMRIVLLRRRADALLQQSEDLLRVFGDFNAALLRKRNDCAQTCGGNLKIAL